ncbi:hypothetical protein PG999_005392 [Apiospora kogelbergensis]|uniref:Uncharacterized protein n=1 Tax=Apiospora kogelbergensis TaxID=1337665 RepID=A0AAW0R1Z1_9PEZI
MFGRHERGRFGGNFVAAFYGDVVNQNGPETVLGEETVIAEKDHRAGVIQVANTPAGGSKAAKSNRGKAGQILGILGD